MTLFARKAWALLALAILSACSPGGETAGDPNGSAVQASGSSGASLADQYTRMQQEAMTEVRAWEGHGNGPDPRLPWAEKLETFAREHPASAPGTEAMVGALQLRAARGDLPGFLAAYRQAFEVMPDAPGLTAAFPLLTLMRMVEAGGPGIMASHDHEAKQRAARVAQPLLEEDLMLAINASRNAGTKAAAHYAIGLACYQLDPDPERAINHFTAIVRDYPDAPQARSAGTYIRELEVLAVGRPAPDFEVTLLDGKKTSLSDLRGRVVLLDFWTTWCESCLDDLPDLRQAYARYRGRGFRIVSVNLDQAPGTVSEFVHLHRIRWTVSSSGMGLSDPVAQAYYVQAIPMSYLIDHEGIIRGRALFGRDVDRAVGAVLRSRR